MAHSALHRHARTLPAWAAGAAVWVLAALAMAGLDGRVDVANLAMAMVLASALSALWWPPLLSMPAAAVAVLVFNFAFVPPRGQLAVDLPQHALLLLTMLAVSWIVALLVARLRRVAADARRHALRAGQLQGLGDLLRDADDPRACAAPLRAALSGLTGADALLLIADDAFGEPDADQRAGLALTQLQNQAMGPGTGRHEEQPAWYLPLRGRQAAFGAALLPLPALPATADTVRAHAQALCDQMGLALERAAAGRSAAAAREEAQSHKLRNTLLAAISHDHRTPLATILGAASSLHDQGERLSPEQRRRLAASIADEAGQLLRLTENTLQLARLDAPGLALKFDWESAEEIVGTVLRHARQRHPERAVKARVEPGLPMLRGDAVMLQQLLDNLVDNALKHGGDGAPVEIVARRIADKVVLAVRDRGPGVDAAWQARIFESFQRGDTAAQRGVGVGLALCRAIARAHGGELVLRRRSHGGSSFECALPVVEVPA